MSHIKQQTFAQVLKELLSTVLNEPDYISSPRGQKIHELLNCSFEIQQPMFNLIQNEHKSSSLKYISAEFMWYLSKSLDPTFISEYASLWNTIKNFDGNICSNYGHLIYGKQFKWAYDSLIEDEHSRQSIFHINNSSHQFSGNKDFVCTMYGQFFIRENKLHLAIHMRSNDIIFGLINDYPFFNILHQQMLRLLKHKYENLEIGSYYHNVGSIHLYERHFTLAKNMLQYDFKEAQLPLLDYDFLDSQTGDVNNILPGSSKFLSIIHSNIN